MANRKKGTCASVTVKDEARLRQKRTKRALGLNNADMLPRCGHKLVKKVRELEAKGDMSHSDKKHFCSECTCNATGGTGTDHFGVAWCYHHEKKHPNKECNDRAVAMTQAIRAGLPDKVWRYKSGSEVLKKIQKDADDAKMSLSLREDLNLLMAMNQEMLAVWEDGCKEDGSEFTESYKGGPGPASDATLIEIRGKLLERVAKLAKVELEITDADFVHWDECKIYFGKIMQLMAKTVDDDEKFNKFLLEVGAVEEPGRGRRKRR